MLGLDEMRFAVALMLFVLTPLVQAEERRPTALPVAPTETTICKILEDPDAFNNTLVQVRGYLSISFEYSVLHSESCSEGIWFVLADGSGPRGAEATGSGHASSEQRGHVGQSKSPIPIGLNRDANFEKFESYLSASTYGPPRGPCGPDCHRYQVTATFTGRIDAVSNETRSEYLQSSPKHSDHKGYGHMGLFDAQLVVQSMKEVEAVDLAHPRLIK
jgi:hypothetical protein